jgi:periplasmic divalent cation tolerance protein
MSRVDTGVRAAFVTAPDPQTAEAMARTLVEERMAACVNVIPGLISVYRWKGDVQRENEALMIVKTTQARAAELRDRIVQLHPYDVPEVVVLNVAAGHEAYLAWVREAVGE